MELMQQVARFVDDGAAEWVRELGFRLDRVEPGDVTFTLPNTPRLTHSGGVVCGQAIMAAMDTGMVYVMASLLGDDEEATFSTVQLQTTFERGAPADTPFLTFHAFATKPGRRLVFGQIDCILPTGTRCATATTQYMWLDRRPKSAE